MDLPAVTLLQFGTSKKLKYFRESTIVRMEL